MEFIAATNNAGKLKELKRILQNMGHDVVSQKEAGITLEPDETGTTFAENAIIKATEICKVSGKPTIADDSGICVDALNGEPGVYSARYCGHHGDDEANNDKLLKELSHLTNVNERKAHFTACVCVCLPSGEKFTFEGINEGWIGFERKGSNGFGYDPIFNVEKFDNRSYAQLTQEEKDSISHRGKALQKMQKELPKLMK